MRKPFWQNEANQQEEMPLGRNAKRSQSAGRDALQMLEARQFPVLCLKGAALIGGFAFAAADAKPRLAVFQSHLLQKEISHELSQARIFELQLGNARDSSGFVCPVADDWLLENAHGFGAGARKLSLTHFAPAMNGDDADAKRFDDFRLGLPFGRESIRRQQFGRDFDRTVPLLLCHGPAC